MEREREKKSDGEETGIDRMDERRARGKEFLLAGVHGLEKDSICRGTER